MKQFFGLALMTAALLATAPFAEAAITCTSITSTGFNAAFSGTVPPTNITPASFTVTCNRNLAGDPTTLTYSVGADNGLAPQGQGNQAQFGANRLKYDAYQDSACGTTWKSMGGNRITDTMTLSGLVATQKSTSYWGCIVTTQVLAAGTYTDTVTMTLTATGVASISNTFPVNIATPATCAFAAPPTLSFTYTAFGAAATSSVQYKPTCTIYLPYSMALDATVGVVNGLQYNLALNTSSSGGSNPLASTGTGAQQTFFINGTMPASQAGTCATGTCSGATSTRTLTITY